VIGAALRWLLPLVFLPALVAPASASAGAKPQGEQRVTELVSTPPAGVADTGVCGAQRRPCEIDVSPDGRSVLFAMSGGPLIEWSAGRTKLVSVGPSGVGNLGTFCGPFSRCGFERLADGSILFETAGSLVPADTDGAGDVYLRRGGVTTLVSTRDPSGTNGRYQNRASAISADQSRIFYEANPSFDADRMTYEWTARTGAHAFPSDAQPAIAPGIRSTSDDGRDVIFTTPSALVPEDTDSCPDNGYATGSGCLDVYERKPDGGIVLLSTGSLGGGGHSNVQFVGGSADQRKVFFFTYDRLVPADTNDARDLYERSGGDTHLLLSGPDGFIGRADHVEAARDGSIFFETTEELVPEDHDGRIVFDPIPDAYVYKGKQDVYKLSDGVVSLVSTGPINQNSYDDAWLGYASPEGRYVTFVSSAELVPGQTGGGSYVRDTVAGTTTSDPPLPPPGSNLFTSADGRRTFFSTRDALVPQDQDQCINFDEGTAPCSDIYERAGGTTTLVSTGPADDGSNCAIGGRWGCPQFEGASPDGRGVFFQTVSTLTSDDTDGGLNDVYVSRVTGPGCPASPKGKLPPKCWGGK
jgi:hypothetical protein